VYRNEVTSEPFSGIIRIALLPELDSKKSKNETVLDRYSSCYPVSGNVVFTKPFCVEYRWEKRGSGDLLMLANRLHLQLLCDIMDCDVTILNDFEYESKDEKLVGVVADSWFLKTDPVSVTWYSSNGVKKEYHKEIVSALLKDVEKLNSSEIKTFSKIKKSYFDGKLIARAARLALIAEEVGFLDVIPKVGKFLKETIEPWLDGTFKENGFLYDKKLGGIVTQQSCRSCCNCCLPSGLYNAQINHLGYFLYAIAVLVKLDPDWGRKYKPQAYSLMDDFMNLSTSSNPNYTRLRCFDLYKLHSLAGGVTKFTDGRYREGTIEAINAYYSATLVGLAYGDADVVSIGSTLTAFEIQAAKRYYFVTLWYYSHHGSGTGFRILPLLPISEVLFSDVDYVKDVVHWALPALLGSDRLEEGWQGFLCALKGQYDKDNSLKKIKKLSYFYVENSFSNLLWWIHSRG
jgi:endo-1,3(4)-beta-glucanase